MTRQALEADGRPRLSYRLASPYHAPMKTPKQACPGTAVTARTSAVPSP